VSNGGGAGAILQTNANADPDNLGPNSCIPAFIGSAAADLEFFNNLVENNQADNTFPVAGCSDNVCEDVICFDDPYCCAVNWDSICAASAALDTACDCGASDCCGSVTPGTAVGAVLARMVAKGDARSTVSIKTSTLAANRTASLADGFNAGIDVVNVTVPDCELDDVGQTSLIIDSSIVVGNDGAGIGGPVPDPKLALVVQYSDIFDNADGNYQSPPFPGDLTGQFGNISEDPLFVAPGSDYHLTVVSPAIDAGNPLPVGFPSEDFEGDPRIADGDWDGTPRVDMGFDELVTCVDDDDGDGDGFSECDGDCADDDPTSYPGATELCDGIDNDCDGTTPSDELDGDGDGFLECADCADDDPQTYPGAPELCDARDNDCDGVIPDDEFDVDGDGLRGCDGDCDDMNAFSYPGAPEIFDGQDNDCDGLNDEGLDDDADGIPNFNDACPDTPMGSGVDPLGCSVCEPDGGDDEDEDDDGGGNRDNRPERLTQPEGRRALG